MRVFAISPYGSRAYASLASGTHPLRRKVLVGTNPAGADLLTNVAVGMGFFQSPDQRLEEFELQREGADADCTGPQSTVPEDTFMAYASGQTPKVGDHVKDSGGRRGVTIAVKLNYPTMPGDDVISVEWQDGGAALTMAAASEFHLISRT